MIRITLYRLPKLIDINAKSVVIRGKDSLLVMSRCIELEHPEIINKFKDRYAIVTVCPEDEHINHVGFKLAGILARGNYREVAVLSVDGSMHCIQLHYMVEEIFKVMGLEGRVIRKHYVLTEGEVREVSKRAVKVSRYLSRVEKILRSTKDT